MRQNVMRAFGASLVGLLLVLMAVGCLVVPQQQQEPDASMLGSGYSVPCYMEQGGAKFVAGSGCEIEVQSGATFDLQSGSTTDFSGGVDLDSAPLTWDADGDTTAVASSDDVVTLALGAATGRIDVLTGNLRIGNGTPTVTQDGEDVYVEGQLEVDGEAQFDGAIDANSTSDFGGNVTVSSGNVAVTTGTLTLEGVAFTGPFVGVTGTISNNVTLAHTLGTTPTAAVCNIVNAGNLTQTIFISATDATNLTLGVFDSEGSVWESDLTVHCIATR